MASKGINKVIIVGNVGKDPEVRYFPSGDCCANITVATSEQWKDKQTGERVERTEWHRIVFFRKLAEIVGEYVTKGMKVYVEGRLQTRKWQAQDGSDRYTTEIVGDVMQMLGGGQDKRDSSPPPQQQRPQQGYQQQSAPPGMDDFDDDIPF